MAPVPVDSQLNSSLLQTGIINVVGRETRQSQDAQPPPHEPCVITGFCKKRQKQTMTG